MSNNAFQTFPQQTDQSRTVLTVQANAPRVHGHRRKNKTKVPVKPIVKQTKRPLNCWMAFRGKYSTSSRRILVAEMRPAYYQSCFASLTQMEISNVMGKIWQHDPFKAKWAIIGKAYSVLRDKLGKENAPLDKFLEIVCPNMSIIEPTQYFVTMGWEITIAEDGEAFMHRNEKPINALYFLSYHGVNEVICESYYGGYFTGDLPARLLPTNEQAMSMTTTAQPTSGDTNPLPVLTETHDDNVDSTIHLNTDGLENDDGVLAMPALAEGVTVEAEPTYSTDEVTQEVTNMTEDAEDASLNAPSPFSRFLVDTTAGQTASLSKGDAHEFQNAHYELEGEYPFNEEFNPDKAATVSFDPFMGNQFDAFDVSDWDQFVDFDQYA